MERIFSHWSLLRVGKLALGLAFVGEGWHSSEWILTLFGIIYGGMALLNIGGCCPAGICEVSQKPIKKTLNPNKITRYFQLRSCQILLKPHNRYASANTELRWRFAKLRVGKD